MMDELKTPKAEAAAHYKEAGVDLEAGYEVQRRIRDPLASTARPGAMASLGRFGGLFDLASLGYKEPVLVSGTDGTGTKIFLAFSLNKHDTVGQDAVAMCVNDVLVQGAEPLFFLDYLALHKADPDIVAALVDSVARACVESGCALIGGETAEMNDLYAAGHYDIAGFAVGVVEKSALITGAELVPGDVLLGLPSTGVHSNGFSLIRKIFFKDHDYRLDTRFPELEQPLGETLLTPTRLYVRPILHLLRSGIRPHGMSHITGGGFFENIPRMSDQAYGYRIQRGSWPVLPIFDRIAREGQLSETEMYNIFNMGIGFIVALPESDAEKAQALLREAGQPSFRIGRVEEKGGVILD